MKKIRGYAKVTSKIVPNLYYILKDLRLQNNFYFSRGKGIKGKLVYCNKPRLDLLISEDGWGFYPLKYFTVEYMNKKQAFFEMI